MTEINKAGETNSLGHIDIPQGEYRSQINALTDAVRQLGGNPEISPGSTVVNDPLSAPYILYVNSYTGSDKFVTGDYASADDGSFEQKMRRIANQRLECGYTEARPFKTINRAAIEAGIITSKDYLDLPGNLCGDLVTIVVQSGVHDVINGPGGSTDVWADGYEPDDDDLRAFNAADGGVILPRGCSVVSMDLRKTNLRPTYVPAFDQERADYSNRSSIFRVTGTGYYYGFTFLDKPNYNESHHLLDTFSFAGRSPRRCVLRKDPCILWCIFRGQHPGTYPQQRSKNRRSAASTPASKTKQLTPSNPHHRISTTAQSVVFTG